MASDSSSSQVYRFFNVTFPQEYVAHVEINRPEKLNSFHTPYVVLIRPLLLVAQTKIDPP